MVVPKSALAVGVACFGTALCAMLAGEGKKVIGRPEPVLTRPEGPVTTDPPQAALAPADSGNRVTAPDFNRVASRHGPPTAKAMRPKPRPTGVAWSSLRPKPRPAMKLGSTIVAAPRPRPRDSLVELAARRRTEWPGLGTRAGTPAAELASRRARLLARAETLVETPPNTLRNATALACLAVSIYHEARNQPELGQHAVAAVILRRAALPHRWQDTVCEVVRPIQFSYLTPDLSFPEIDEPEAWRDAVAIAAAALLRGPHPDFAQADHYHRRDVTPAWNSAMDVVARVADHVFLRDPRSRRFGGRDQTTNSAAEDASAG